MGYSGKIYLLICKYDFEDKDMPRKKMFIKKVDLFNLVKTSNIQEICKFLKKASPTTILVIASRSNYLKKQTYKVFITKSGIKDWDVLIYEEVIKFLLCELDSDNGLGDSLLKSKLNKFETYLSSQILKVLNELFEFPCGLKFYSLEKIEKTISNIIPGNSEINNYLEVLLFKSHYSKTDATEHYIGKDYKENLCTDFQDMQIGDNENITWKTIKSISLKSVPSSSVENVPKIPRSVMFALLGWSGTKPNISIEIFDSVSEKWFFYGQRNFMKRAYHGVVAVGILIYVIGGFDGNNSYNSTYCFNVERRLWYRKPSMHETRCYVTALGHQNMIYAIGGFNGRDRMKSCERYNPSTRRWQFMRSMNVRRSDASGAVHKGKLYICGGFSGVNILISAEVYDIKSNQWSFIPSLNGPRSGQSMVSYKDSLYVLGGFDGLYRLETVDRYDEDMGVWVQHSSMLCPRSNFAAVVMGDELYVIGGYNGETTTSDVEKFDGKTSWHNVPGLKCHRSALGACVFDDSSQIKICCPPGDIVIRKRDIEQQSP